jgi:hypothetical protein
VDLTRIATISYYAIISADVSQLCDAQLVSNRPPSSSFFDLVKKLRDFNNFCIELVPTLELMSLSRAFEPIFILWIYNSSEKILAWCDEALKVDSSSGWVPIDEKQAIYHSSSIVDLFTSIYQPLHMIIDFSYPTTV